MRDHARLDRAGDAHLAHGGGVRLERVAGVEGAGLHDVDVLRHVELIDGVVAFLETRRGQGRFRHGHVGRSGRRHDLRALEVLERARRIALADDELLHLVGLVLAVERDVHGDAGLLQVGVHALDGHQHGGSVDLVGDHGGDVRRSADQPHHLRLDVLFLEEAALQRHEIGQRRAHGEYPDLDLVLSGGRNRREHHQSGNGRKYMAAGDRVNVAHCTLSGFTECRAFAAGSAGELQVSCRRHSPTSTMAITGPPPCGPWCIASTETNTAGSPIAAAATPPTAAFEWR